MSQITLSDENQDTLKDQILIVLADYQTCDKDFLKSESCRLDIANRIMDTMRVVACRGY